MEFLKSPRPSKRPKSEASADSSSGPISGPISLTTLAWVGAALLASTPLNANVYNVADENAKALKEASRQLCDSTNEYVETLKFLRKTKDFNFKEDASRKIAMQVAHGCNGASERFAQVLVTLKTMGLTERGSLKMALTFAEEAPETQKNFVEIFSKSYLTEFFDYEYDYAMKLALDLSRGYKGNAAVAREDFLTLVKFCKQGSSLDLPMKFCSDYAEKVAKLSQYFPDGVAKPFLQLFAELREKKEFSFDIKKALQYTHDILAHGPNASKNFFSAFEFATKDHEYSKLPAMELALKLAFRSHTGDTPPVLQFPSEPRPDNASQDVLKP